MFVRIPFTDSYVRDFDVAYVHRRGASIVVKVTSVADPIWITDMGVDVARAFTEVVAAMSTRDPFSEKRRPELVYVTDDLRARADLVSMVRRSTFGVDALPVMDVVVLGEVLSKVFTDPAGDPAGDAITCLIAGLNAFER